VPSSSRQQDSSPPAHPALIADLALPAIPVVRKHVLNASFITARIRLMSLISDGSLVTASIEAYAHVPPKLARLIPADALSASALIAVRMTEPSDATGMIVLPVRWHATGAGGQPVRVLNADLMLVAAGPSRTLLRLHGAFRLPFAVAGHDRVAQRAASASVSFLVNQIRQHLARPAPGGAPA
jgi:hypothetical protein